jgi:hypothetical protein
MIEKRWLGFFFVVIVPFALALLYFALEGLLQVYYLWGKEEYRWYLAVFAFPQGMLIPTFVFVLSSLAFQRFFRLKGKVYVGALLLGSVVIFIASFRPYLFASERPVYARLRGFSDLVKSRISPAFLESWADQVFEASPKPVERQLRQNEIPREVLGISALVPAVELEQHGDRRLVRIDYGGGFGHWGLIVKDRPGVIPDNSKMISHKWTERIDLYLHP